MRLIRCLNYKLMRFLLAGMMLFWCLSASAVSLRAGLIGNTPPFVDPKSGRSIIVDELSILFANPLVTVQAHYYSDINSAVAALHQKQIDFLLATSVPDNQLLRSRALQSFPLATLSLQPALQTIVLRFPLIPVNSLPTKTLTGSLTVEDNVHRLMRGEADTLIAPAFLIHQYLRRAPVTTLHLNDRSMLAPLRYYAWALPQDQKVIEAVNQQTNLLNEEDARWLEQKWLLPSGSVSSARHPPTEEQHAPQTIIVNLPDAPVPWVKLSPEGKVEGIWVDLLSSLFPVDRFSMSFNTGALSENSAQDQIRIIASQEMPSPEAQFFDVLHWGIISPDNAPLASERTLLQNKRLAILRRSPLRAAMLNAFPQANLVEVDHIAEALALVKAGGADGMAGETLSLREAMKSLNIQGMQLAPLDVPPTPLWFIAQGKNLKETESLRQILASVTQADIENSRIQQPASPPEIMFSHAMLWLIVMGIISFCAALIALTAWGAAQQQRRQREQDTAALHNTLAQWQTLVNNAPVPLFVCDPAGYVVRYNATFGQAPFLPHPLDKQIFASDLPLGELARQLALPQRLKLLNQSAPVRGETTLEDGTTLFWWLCRYTDHRNRPQGIVGGWVDISEKAALTQALNHALARTERASEEKSIFLARMSHDIRTPLNAVLGMLEMEREENQSIEIAWQAAITLRDLIGDILDLSRIEAGELALDIKPHSLMEVLQAGDAIFSRSAMAKGLEWQSELNIPADSIFMFDKTRLNQVVANLLGNAIKYTPQGSIGFYAHHTDEVLFITITDTGVGIPPNALSMLGQAWFQVDHHTPQSSGLGLTICNQLVTLMQGSLQITSEPGRGTEVNVMLPLASAELKIIPAPAIAPAATLPARHVLVVDDFKLNLTVITLQLEKLGQRVSCCDTPQAALAFMAQQYVDVLITDCQMPDMDGYQLVQTLLVRDMLGQAHAPALIMGCTASALPQEEEHARHSGMDELLRKPLLSSHLEQALGQYSDNSYPDLNALNVLANHQKEILSLMYQQIQEAVSQDLAALNPLPAPEILSRIAHRLKSTWSLTGLRQAQRSCLVMEALPSLLADGTLSHHEIELLAGRFQELMQHSLTLLAGALNDQSAAKK